VHSIIYSYDFTHLILRANKSDCVLLSVSIAVDDFVGFSMSPKPVNPAIYKQMSHICTTIKHDSLRTITQI